MPVRGRVQAYPWGALEPVDRRAERTLRRARRWLDRAASPLELAASLSAIVGAEVKLTLGQVRACTPKGDLTCVGLSPAAGQGRCVVALEPALATALLATLLRRRLPLVDASVPLDPTLHGALTALLVEAARRSSAALALRPAPAAPEQGWTAVDVAVTFEGRPYAAALWVAPVFADEAPAAPALLAALSDVEIALPLVVASSLASAVELAHLSVGSAWCPRAGAWVDRAGVGRGVLAPRASERGLGVELGSGGKIVLREPAIVPLAITEAMAMNREQPSEPTTLADAVLDAPVVVRVELGHVSMAARDWARLKPGDVLETGHRVGGPVVLSSGGRVLARGELVDVEGELGVRVTELLLETRS